MLHRLDSEKHHLPKTTEELVWSYFAVTSAIAARFLTAVEILSLQRIFDATAVEKLTHCKRKPASTAGEKQKLQQQLLDISTEYSDHSILEPTGSLSVLLNKTRIQ